ncbi:MAG: 16S rRNA (cytidine(1402)-2'-O)-methyltransferase [Synergistaceae bacterium]|nr:16S rRNA (cytidine(1402)-2'-O)-methyltransferase [Synergistaceae bacterium]
MGNLGDMTQRGLDELRKADLIACEDTRTSLPLLRHFGISRPLAAYHSFNEREKAEELLSRLAGGARVALISDAGTPGISDPGYEIVRQCIAAGAEVTVLPGATAFVPALILSGLPPYPFLFYGFLPDKKGEREKAILSVASLPWTLIFYLSPHKAEKHLGHLLELLGDRKAALVREISKIYEEARRGTLSFLTESVREGIRGELVLVVEGASPSAPSPEVWRGRAGELLKEGKSPREVVKILSGEYGLSKNEVKSFLFTEGKE